jgi:hypothetical protein
VHAGGAEDDGFAVDGFFIHANVPYIYVVSAIQHHASFGARDD